MSERNRKYNYRSMRDQYIASDSLSIRELALRHHVPINSMSTINRMARMQGWDELRVKRQTKSDDKTVALIADKDASRRVRKLEVADNALEVINDAISKLRVDMNATKKVQDPETKEWLYEPAVRYRPTEVVQLIDRIQGLFGDTASVDPARTEGRFFALSGSLDGADPAQRELIAGLAGLARSQPRPVDTGRVGDSPLPSSPGARTD